MVGAMGRQSYIWHLLRAARAARDRRRPSYTVDSARGRLAEVEAERRRRMGRELPERQGPELARARDEHRLADGVGADRAASRRGRHQRERPARHPMAAGAAEWRGLVGREGVHRQRIPQSLLYAVLPLSALLPVAGIGELPGAAAAAE